MFGRRMSFQTFRTRLFNIVFGFKEIIKTYLCVLCCCSYQADRKSIQLCSNIHLYERLQTTTKNLNIVGKAKRSHRLKSYFGNHF